VLVLPPDVANVLALFTFTYGSGGTDVTAYLQTSFNQNGTDFWVDIIAFNALLADKTNIYNLNSGTAVTTAVVPADGALTDNTAQGGIIGDKLRVKYTTTGTYASDTTLQVAVSMKSLTTDKGKRNVI
jgi:hypothetical protein